MQLNSVTLVGHAFADPEVRYFESGSVCANIRLGLRPRDSIDDPVFFNLELWGKQAQAAADHVRKGSLIGIIGSIKLDRWTDRSTGEAQSATVIRVDRLELLDSGK
jgi:single-strand DNA-binding protein